MKQTEPELNTEAGPEPNALLERMEEQARQCAERTRQAVETMKQAHIRRLLRELNANSMQRKAIEEELAELGHDVRRREKQK